jgi:hypothetical protein
MVRVFTNTSIIASEAKQSVTICLKDGFFNRPPLADSFRMTFINNPMLSHLLSNCISVIIQRQYPLGVLKAESPDNIGTTLGT